MSEPAKPRKVVFCVPTITKPYPQFVAALEASLPLVKAAGWDDYAVSEVGNPYISVARATMLRKALDIKPEVVVFLDHDLSWRARDLLDLIETPGDVVAGTYRFKKPEERYMGSVHSGPNGTPLVREDGCIKGEWAPAGFLKVTTDAINRIMTEFPDLCFGPRYNLSVDLFNHGAHRGIWWGEDYAFCRRWSEIGGTVWIRPDLDLTHWGSDGTPYLGNFHQFLRRQPGGDLDPAREQKEAA